MRYNSTLKVAIKKVLIESLGVPDNLYETSVEVYNRFVDQLNNIENNTTETENTYSFVISDTFRIADFEFSKVEIELQVAENNQFSNPEIIHMAIPTQAERTEDFKLKYIKSTDVVLNIFIAIPENYNVSELQNYFKSKKKEIIEMLSHEFKHSYDNFKRIFDKVKERALYVGVTNGTYGIYPIDLFLHDIYYTLNTENLVRPSEVVSAIRNNEISQKGFIDFLLKNDTYKNLKRISNFSFENLKKQLKLHIKEIDSVLKSRNISIDEISEDEKIETILKMVMDDISDITIENFKEILARSPFELLFGFKGEKLKLFRKFEQRQKRFKMPEDFFRFYENQFHFVSNLMLRKIAKLYALLDSKRVEKNSNK